MEPIKYYRLDGRDVRECALDEHGRPIHQPPGLSRRVGETYVKQVRISTVFLGIDHQFGVGGRPLLFETMVFGGQLNEEMERYSTYDEAEAGHAAMVERVRQAELSEVEYHVRKVRKEKHI